MIRGPCRPCPRKPEDGGALLHYRGRIWHIPHYLKGLGPTIVYSEYGDGAGHHLEALLYLRRLPAPLRLEVEYGVDAVRAATKHITVH